MVDCLGNPPRRGSVTVAGAVSPPGADFSEPVTQNTLRIVDALFALDVSLANKRHFPTISWLTSYSLYVDAVKDWWNKFDPGWEGTRAAALKMLQQEAELEEIVRLVGPEALPEGDKLLLLAARMIREDFLQQSAYNEVDTYCTPGKAGLMLKTITKFYDLAQEMLNSGVGYEAIRTSPMVYRISRMKDMTNEDSEEKTKELWAEMEESLVARKRAA
jgi:V/A-type H+-transporting ATPase subunit A